MLYINYLHFFICTFALRSLQKSSLKTFFIVSTEELRTKNEKNHNISTRCQPKRAEIKNRKHKIYKRIRNTHTHTPKHIPHRLLVAVKLWRTNGSDEQQKKTKQNVRISCDFVLRALLYSLKCNSQESQALHPNASQLCKQKLQSSLLPLDAPLYMSSKF